MTAPTPTPAKKPKTNGAGNHAAPPSAPNVAELLAELVTEQRRTNTLLEEQNRHAQAAARASIKVARFAELCLEQFAIQAGAAAEAEENNHKG